MQQSTGSSGQLKAADFFSSPSLTWIAGLLPCFLPRGVCLPFQCLKSWHAAPPAGVPSTRRLQEQHLGGCARSPSCTLHGEKISWLMVYRLPVMTGLVYKCYHPCMEIERCVRWTQAAADTTHSHSRDAVRNHNDAVAKFRNCIQIVSLYGAMN